MIALRAVRASDHDALFAIADANAADRYDDPRLMGAIYSVPYAVFSSHRVFVAEDEEGPGGYVVGVVDTRAFEARLERDWWPALRRAHRAPTGDPSGWTPDQRRHHAFHHPRETPAAVALSHPAHLHLQVLPRLQGRGIGTALLDRWLGEAQTGVHVGVNAANHRGLAFWRRRGFSTLAEAPSRATIWLGLG